MSETNFSPGQIFQQAVMHHQAGFLQDAERLYRTILAAVPDHPDVNHNLGILAFQTGRSNEGLPHLKAALEASPLQGQYWLAYLEGLLATKHWPDAASVLAQGRRRGLAGKAVDTISARLDAWRDAMALVDRGVADYADGRAADALYAYRVALALAPDVATAIGNLGVVLADQGHMEQAEVLYRRALHCYSEAAEVHGNLGNVQRSQGKAAASLSYRRSMVLKPDYAVAMNNLGALAISQDAFEEAIFFFSRAMQIRPDYAEALYNQGIALYAAARYTDAIDKYCAALALQPNYAEAYSNLGMAFKAEARLTAAHQCYHHAQRLRPHYAEVKWNEALAHLIGGDLAAGLPLYEWRWQGMKDLKPRNFPQSQWTGEDLGGKTILIHAEQGLGDSLHFCRYLEKVVACGPAEIVLEVQRPLVALLSQLPGLTQIVARGEPLPVFDIHCPLLSLPGVFRTTLKTIPCRPYLRAEPDRIDRWRKRLSSSGFRIGIVWQGNPAYQSDRQRSVPLNHFATLARLPGVQLISLQKTFGLDQLRDLPERMTVMTLPDLDAGSNAFLDSAAVMMSLDLIISIDSAPLHLAGALGRPVWALLSRAPHWPWMLEREDTPWYPTMRLFRQTAQGDWRDVFGRLATVLQNQLESVQPSISESL